MIGSKLGRIVALVGAVALLGLAFSPQADAAGRLKAQLYLTQAKIPKTLTEKGLIRFARSKRAKLLRETKDGPLDKRKWKATLVVAFNRPPGDLEFQVLFYDIHDGPRRFVQDLSTFVSNRKEKTFVQKIKLPRPDFKPNRNMEMVVTVRRQEVGRLKFGVLGEEKRRSGEVSFSDDER